MAAIMPHTHTHTQKTIMKTKTQYKKTAHKAYEATTHADAINTSDAHTAAYNAHCAALTALGKMSFVDVQVVRKHAEIAMRHFQMHHDLRGWHPRCPDCEKEFASVDERDNHFMSPACSKHRPTLWQ